MTIQVENKEETVNKYCGGAFSPHLPAVSRHYRVVVEAFASGQCGPGSIPGRSRNWSDSNNIPKYYPSPGTAPLMSYDL